MVSVGPRATRDDLLLGSLAGTMASDLLSLLSRVVLGRIVLMARSRSGTQQLE
jgi:hypothetical protein